MDFNTPQFYDLVSRAFNGDATSRRLQTFVDSTMSLKYNGLKLDGFPFDPDMQLDYTYEQIQKELGITPMASYYDVDSPAIPKAEQEISLATGRIPRMKEVMYFNEDKVRKQLILEKMLSDEKIPIQAGQKLFDVINELIGRHTNSLTYQRDQMVSAGKLVLNDKNNPDGTLRVTLSANVPLKNKKTLSGDEKFWKDKTYAQEGAKADPIQSIIDWLQPILDKGIKGHIEINLTYYRRLLRHSKVNQTIGFGLWPTTSAESATGAATVLPLSKKTSALEDLLGVKIKTVDSISSVLTYNTTSKRMEPTTAPSFNPDVIVFIPDGNVGKVLTVMPISIQDNSALVSTFYDGRLMLTVARDAVTKCQGFHTEMTPLVVPNVPQYFFYLFPNES
uniref:major capsid protein n=1 Tax=Candidatus Cryptobacteroides bacterium TaxID=3085639 RepID=UPI0040290F7A